MLAKDSILRRLPRVIEPKQALFIDGIRHAVEIIDLAYARLRETLTQIATSDKESLDVVSISTYAFLDAWAIIDAIDRFQMLYQKMPGAIKRVQALDAVSFKNIVEPYRKLRNIADHLAAQADRVVSEDGAALGVLTWFTGFKVDPITAWKCTLRPGTIRIEPKPSKEPIVMTFDWPTDRICLSVGNTIVDLASIFPHIALRVESLESNIQASLDKLGLRDAPAASDVLIKVAYKLGVDQKDLGL